MYIDVKFRKCDANISTHFSGYTLLPQVMGGFYHPLVQPVQMQVVSGVATPIPHPDFRSAAADTLAGAGEPPNCSAAQEDKVSHEFLSNNDSFY